MYLFVRSIRTQTSASTGLYEKMSIATRLRSVLDKKGLSIKEASELVGIPYRTLQNYLLDEREPNAKALSAIRTHLGISVDWLLTGEGTMTGDAPQQEQTGTATVNPQEEAILELFRSLGEAGRREIQSAAEEKKRLMDVEQRLKDLTEILADTKRPA
ncbi:helix-turn-helix domain-containing protein [Pseudomonas sp. WS 5071]|nr:helix-turn-helix domain-containing protein [Pseudomonas sp. WS 5071]